MQAITKERLKPKNATYKSSSKLMEDYRTFLPVNANGRIKVIDQDAQPILFSIGTNQELYAIFQEDDTHSGWVLHDLSSQLGTATAFDVRIGETGLCTIGLGVENNGQHYFYLSEELDIPSTNFKKINTETFWKTKITANGHIDTVKVHETDAIYSTSGKKQFSEYFIVQDRQQLKFTLNENAKHITKADIGYLHGEKGAFLLYPLGTDMQLAFQPFEQGGRSSRFKSQSADKVNFKAKDFALLHEVGEESTKLVAASDRGLFLFEKYVRFGHPTQLSTANFDFEQIEITSDGTHQTIWARGQEQTAKESKLYMLTNKFFDQINSDYTKKWTSPIALYEDVEQFTCMRGTGIRNHLFCINKLNQITHLWQDDATTLWNTQSIHIHAPDVAKKVNAYVLEVKFMEQGKAVSFVGEEVTISSSSACYIDINSKVYQMDQDKSVTVVLDRNANVFFSNLANSISAPTLYLRADFLAEELVIDMARETVEALGQKINAEGENSELLSDVKDKKAAVQGIRQFTQLARHLHQKQVAQINPNKKVAKTPSSISFGISTSPDGTVKTMGTKAFVDKVMADASSDKENSGHSFGDVFHKASNFLENTFDFFVQLVNDVGRIIIKIGEEVYNFIVETAEEIYHALKTFFHRLEIVFKKIIEILGFLFNWGDILETKDLLVDLINSGFDGLATFVKNMDASFNGWVDHLQHILGNDDLLNQHIQHLEKQIGDPFAENNSQNKHLNQGDPDPHANWLSSKKGHLANTSIGSFTSDGGWFSDVMGIVKQELKDDAVAAGIVWEDIVKELGRLQAGNISFGDFLKYLAKKLGGLVLQIFRSIVDGLLRVIEVTIEDVKKALNSVLDIPLISTLYKLIAKHELTLLDFGCLIMALPTTITFKLLTQQKPTAYVNNLQGFTEITKNGLATIAFPQYDAKGNKVTKTQQVIPVIADIFKDGKEKVLKHGMLGITRLARVFTFSINTIVGLFKVPVVNDGLTALDMLVRLLERLVFIFEKIPQLP